MPGYRGVMSQQEMDDLLAGREKINEVALGFSRDGFHWDRPDRSAFLSVSDTPGALLPRYVEVLVQTGR